MSTVASYILAAVNTLRFQYKRHTTLLILKKLLNSIDDEDLKEFDLWIDNSKRIDVVAIDKNAISLITDEAILKINDRE